MRNYTDRRLFGSEARTPDVRMSGTKQRRAGFSFLRKKHLIFRAQSNKDTILDSVISSHDFAEHFRQAYTGTPD
jgi:hypothetical protein